LIADGLREALAPLGPPAWYLDFETFSPALPVHVGSSPYQRIPFQWSLHADDGNGDIRHFEFLATGNVDPRRELAETPEEFGSWDEARAFLRRLHPRASDARPHSR
jgi:hypothetical protein